MTCTPQLQSEKWDGGCRLRAATNSFPPAQGSSAVSNFDCMSYWATLTESTSFEQHAAAAFGVERGPEGNSQVNSDI